MKKAIFVLAVTAALAALTGCPSNSSNNGNPTGQNCVNGVCYATNSAYNTCGANSGYPSPYGYYQMIGSQCMDTRQNIVVQPSLCNNGLNNGYNNGLNNNLYSPYCNPYAGYQPYVNPAGNYPYTGICPLGSMQLFDQRTGITNCMPWSNYGQIAPYATPTPFGGQTWFYFNVW